MDFDSYQKICETVHKRETAQLLDNKQAAVLLGLSATAVEVGYTLNVLKKQLYQYDKSLNIDWEHLEEVAEDVSPMILTESQSAKIHAVLGALGEITSLLKLCMIEAKIKKDPDTEMVKNEIGDCLYYLARLASSYDLSLEDCAKHNKNKVTQFAEREPQR